MRKFLITLLSLCLILVSAGCEIIPEGTTAVDADELKPGKIIPQLRVGVRIRVAVSASGTIVIPEEVKEVSATGDIIMPLVNTFHCEGMTIQDFQNKLTDAYKEYYLEPLVSALYLPMSEGGSSPYGQVLVTGSVAREGVVDIPPTCDLTVMQAIQAAGGIGVWGSKKVYLTRNLADGTRQRLNIDTDAIGRRGETQNNIVLMPGDIIYVPESSF